MNDHLIELNFIPNSLFTNGEGGGIQRIYDLGVFSSGRKARLSVICSPSSNGGRLGLWEAALIADEHLIDLNCKGGTLGWLSDADVSDVVRYFRGQIAAGVSPFDLPVAPWTKDNRGENDD
jgi:hypothetical protein